MLSFLVEVTCLSNVFYPSTPVGDPWGLADMTVSPELTVHVGDSAFMGCVVQSTEEKPVVKVDWILSNGKYAEVRRWPDCVVKPLANGVRTAWVWENQSLSLQGSIARASEGVITGSSLSLAIWLCVISRADYPTLLHCGEET